MSRGVVTKVGIALVVLLLATFSTARAHQVWSEHEAQSKVQAARSAAYAELAHAVKVGVLPAEVAPLRAEAHALDAQAAPSGSPLWNSETLSFYTHQVDQYHRLNRAIASGVARSAQAARTRATALSSDLEKTIASASRLDLDTSGPAKTLQSQKAVIAQPNVTPGKLHAVDAMLAGANSTLSSRVTSQTAVVQKSVDAAGGSLPTLLSQADASASAAHSQLSLLGIVNPSDARLGARVDAALAVVHAQKDTFSAAVKMAPLQVAVSAVDTHYKKDLPSKIILVSTENQDVTMYENGKQVYSSVVTTGGPELPTDHGVFHIYDKISPFTFHSPWPEGSPYYYPPSPVSYWMPFDGAQGLHDAPWRANWGPGSNLMPTDLGGHYILGTHGCVNLPPATAQFIWDWAPVGTTVAVV